MRIDPAGRARALKSGVLYVIDKRHFTITRYKRQISMRAKLAGVTPVQAQILKALVFTADKQAGLYPHGLRAVDIDPEAGSTLYEALKRMLDEGLVSKHEHSGGQPGYKLTEAGSEKWRTLQLLTNISGGAVTGAANVQSRLRAFAAICNAAKF